MSKPALNIDSLTSEERLRLIEELWESLRESLRAHLHFHDAVPMPSGPQPNWMGSSQFIARTPFVLRVPDVAVTATAAAWILPSGKHAA